MASCAPEVSKPWAKLLTTPWGVIWTIRPPRLPSRDCDRHQRIVDRVVGFGRMLEVDADRAGALDRNHDRDAGGDVTGLSHGAVEHRRHRHGQSRGEVAHEQVAGGHGRKGDREGCSGGDGGRRAGGGGRGERNVLREIAVMVESDVLEPAQIRADGPGLVDRERACRGRDGQSDQQLAVGSLHAAIAGRGWDPSGGGGSEVGEGRVDRRYVIGIRLGHPHDRSQGQCLSGETPWAAWSC